MRGEDEETGALFSYLSPDALVPRDHPLRAVRQLVNAGLNKLSAQVRRSIPPTAAPRLHRRSCCAHCCCKPFTAFARSAS
jgi:hypothetical protein